MSIDCAICMEPLPPEAHVESIEQSGRQGVGALPPQLVCGHEKCMHTACLRRWIALPGRSCPICRAPVVASMRPRSSQSRGAYRSGRVLVQLQRSEPSPPQAPTNTPIHSARRGSMGEMDRYPNMSVHSRMQQHSSSRVMLDMGGDGDIEVENLLDPLLSPVRMGPLEPGTLGVLRIPPLVCSCRILGLHLVHFALWLVFCISLLLRWLRRSLDVLIRVMDSLLGENPPWSVVSEELRNELAGMSLRELRSKSIQLNVSTMTLRYHRRAGESLARRNDYEAILLRALP